MRGAAEWEDADEVHYPGTYAHGVYDRETTIMGGRPVPNEDLVNLPNCLVLKFRVEGEEPFGLGNVELLSYRHDYDVRNAVVMRELRFRDRAGRETTPHEPALREHGQDAPGGARLGARAGELVGAGRGGAGDRRAGAEPGVARYRQLEGRHLDPAGAADLRPRRDRAKVRTRQSRIEIARGRAHARLSRASDELAVDRSTYQTEDYIQQVLAFDVHEGVPVRVEKLTALYTSRDRAITEPLLNAGQQRGPLPAFRRGLERHARAWEELWEVCDVRFPASRARAVPAAVPHLARPAGVLPADRPP